eukprot:SAG31_NODE_347_length_17310_cov_3.764743_12_plen_379_part_00
MMHCRLMEVQSACCSDARNCPDSSPVPHRCSVQCALVFPTMVDSCAEELESGGLDMDEYRSFADRCMRQDGTALVEYAHDLVRQGCEIDLVSPQDRGRRAQDNEGSAQKTGIAKMLQTNENTCSWQSFDDRVVEMSAVCCGTNADEVCADGQPPRQCSPECAVYFHSFYSDCETLLSTIQQDDMDKFTDFEATCMDEADASFFLTAIKHATCVPVCMSSHGCLANCILRTFLIDSDFCLQVVRAAIARDATIKSRAWRPVSKQPRTRQHPACGLPQRKHVKSVLLRHGYRLARMCATGLGTTRLVHSQTRSMQDRSLGGGSRGLVVHYAAAVDVASQTTCSGGVSVVGIKTESTQWSQTMRAKYISRETTHLESRYYP